MHRAPRVALAVRQETRAIPLHVTEVLKREVEAAIHAKVTARRQEIESALSKLSLLDGGGRGKVVRAAAREWVPQRLLAVSR
jgi:hypothetical protein